MRHVAPSRWVELAKLSVAERDKLERHATACPRCAGERDRVLRASEAFGALRAQPAPELGWDSIRARIHWSVSSERRASERATASEKRRPLAVFALGLAGAAAIGTIAVAIDRLSGDASDAPAPIATRTTPAIAPAPVAPVAPVALAGLVDRISGDVMIDGVRRADRELFAHHLVAGSVIATGEGHVDVQFGDASAFQVGPHSTLELRRFDADAIELAVDGSVDVTVAPRAKGQRFIVHAGSRDVEVRGTQFRVTRDGAATRVACRHGLVAVRDDRGQLEVAGERGVTLASDRAVADAHAEQLAPAELASLVASTPYTLPLWLDADAVGKTSAPLEIAGARDVRVDGIEYGVAPLQLRVLPGRHTVEAADLTGRFHRVGWVDVTLAGVAHVEIPAEAAPVPATTGRALREKQLHDGLDRARLASCVRQIAKAGMTDTFVDVEIAVDASGAIGMLNVLDGDLPSTTRMCVREVLADVHFGAGPSATWREKITP